MGKDRLSSPHDKFWDILTARFNSWLPNSVPWFRFLLLLASKLSPATPDVCCKAQLNLRWMVAKSCRNLEPYEFHGIKTIYQLVQDFATIHSTLLEGVKNHSCRRYLHQLRYCKTPLCGVYGKCMN